MNKRVGIAIGHGGSDSGAVSGSFVEKTMNLKVGLKVRDRLNTLGFTTLLNRTTDTAGGEANFASSIAGKVDFAVAVHFNAFSDPSANGFEAGRNRNYAINDSTRLCQIIEKYVNSDIKIRSRGIKVFDFAMTNNKYPCAYLEGGFISSPIDRAYFDTDDKLNMLAEAYVKGICEYAGVVYGADGDSVQCSEPQPQPTEQPSSVVTTVTTYKAVRGDTMTKIATRFGVSLSALMEANPQIKDINKINVWQVVNIPSVLTYVHTKKSVEEVAQEIWKGQGDWGNDPERRQKLIAYGGEQFRNDVQARVNKIAKTGK